MSPDFMLGKAGSLHRRLLKLLLFPLLILLLLALLVDYQIAFEPAIEAYDHALVDDLLDLSNHVKDEDGTLTVELPPAVRAMLRSNVGDDEFFAVFSPDGRLLVGDEELKPEPGHLSESLHLADSTLRGVAIRKVTYRLPTRTGDAYVVMAETTMKRHKAGSKILMGMLIPNVLLIMATVILIGFGIRQGLSPLSRLGEAISRRPSHDFSPLPDIAVPGEAEPLIAEIRQLIENLRAAASAHEAFLADAAHQLKTPLAGLQTQLDLLAEDPADRRDERLTRIRQSMDRLNRMTHQLLALARSTPEALAAYQMMPVDLSLLIEEVASSWFDHALRQGVGLSFETVDAGVVGIPWLLKELLSNLVDNALRYSGPDGQVVVRCGLDRAHRPFLEVEDNGPGIPMSERTLVFERFYRIRGAQPPGTGLGLAIVREVALRHGAEVSIDHGGDGRGTRVRVSFPARS